MPVFFFGVRSAIADVTRISLAIRASCFYICGLRASAPIWASEASLARTRVLFSSENEKSESEKEFNERLPCEQRPFDLPRLI